jgi:polyisoprenyl-phosphate glycosyltransferase
MEKDSKIALSVIVPIYNEQEIIQELYARLTKAAQSVTPRYEIIFVNDGSRDQSLAGLKAVSQADSRCFYINFSRNFGHQIAVSAGLDMCSGKAVVIIDGDLQDPPELIPELYNKLQDGYEVVYAKRASRKGESWFKKLTARVFYRMMKRITSINIPVDTGDFRIIDRKIVEQLKLMPERNKFLRGQIAWLGFRQTYVEFVRDERKFGETGYPFSKMLRFAIDGITGFSDKPLELVTRMGLIFSCFAFVVIVYAIYSHFVLDQTITGWTSLIISAMFLGGIQLLSIGIIGEYISRINNQVRERPLYIIEDTNLNNHSAE